MQSLYGVEETTTVNDPADYRLPYGMSTKTDSEIMYARYQNLKKVSYGAIVRLGAGFYG